MLDREMKEEGCDVRVCV